MKQRKTRARRNRPNRLKSEVGFSLKGYSKVSIVVYIASVFYKEFRTCRFLIFSPPLFEKVCLVIHVDSVQKVERIMDVINIGNLQQIQQVIGRVHDVLLQILNRHALNQIHTQ